MNDTFPVTDWLLATPLYTPIAFETEEIAIQGAKALIGHVGTFDHFCPACGQPATFRTLLHSDYEGDVKKQRLAAAVMSGGPTQFAWVRHELRKAAVCTRNGNHVLIFYFLRRDSTLTKVGQSPSIADLACGDTRAFSKALSSDQLRELNTAIGLVAHGVGVGAFVYLRRIFESLVEEAHEAAEGDSEWDESAYQKLRMAERLPLLAGHLPRFLVEHANLYSILSLHLHELSDVHCRASFDIVKQGIFAIAEERLAERQRKARATAARNAINSFKPPPR